MVDYNIVDILSALDKMCGYAPGYLLDAIKSQNVKAIAIDFDVTKDTNNVPVKVQHIVKVAYKS